MDINQIRQDFVDGKIPTDEYIAALEADNQAQREINKAQKEKHARKPSELRAKVSEKGALSIYGLGRFPVTLYSSQWRRLLTFDILGYLDEHASELKQSKDD
jgi:hypothetical protein